MEELRIEEIINPVPKEEPADDKSAGFFIVSYELDNTVDFSIP